MSYYLKIDADTLLISDESTEYNVDLPTRSFSQVNIMADGGIVSGNGKFRGRQITLSKVFIKDKEQDRIDFIDFFNAQLNKTLYFYKAITGFTGKMRVYGSPGGGEAYRIKRSAFSDSVAFKLWSEDAYFTSTTETTGATKTITSTIEETETITLNGVSQAVVWEFTPTADFTTFQIKNDSGNGFIATHDFKNGDAIVIDTRGSDLSCTVNGSPVLDLFSNTSTPFPLSTGDNTIYVTATSGSLNIRYSEKRL